MTSIQHAEPEPIRDVRPRPLLCDEMELVGADLFHAELIRRPVEVPASEKWAHGDHDLRIEVRLNTTSSTLNERTLLVVRPLQNVGFLRSVSPRGRRSFFERLHGFGVLLVGLRSV